ncbi:MAG: aminoglycoside phosphotransferase family protein [Candidatus Wallbacteria bacterium]|nr:aminoglycoside phosphotransferase family protein [Candidatus Wallbacteria bacterium]
MNISDCIAKGRTAELFDLPEGRVLKLYFSTFHRSTVEKEFRNTLAVHKAGLPVPFPHEIIVKNDRYGIVYEKVNGKIMTELMQETGIQLWISQFADLHRKIHRQTDLKNLRILSHKLTENIQSVDFPERASKLRLLKMLSLLNHGASLCHGDFHPGNIIVSQPGPVIIDWTDCSIGNPMADVARTVILIEESGCLSDESARQLCSDAITGYLEEYFQDPEPPPELEKWKILICAARISEGLDQKTTEWLHGKVRNGLGSCALV